MSKKDKKLFKELKRLRALYPGGESPPPAKEELPPRESSSLIPSSPPASPVAVAPALLQEPLASFSLQRELLGLGFIALLTLAFLFLLSYFVLASAGGEKLLSFFGF